MVAGTETSDLFTALLSLKVCHLPTDEATVLGYSGVRPRLSFLPSSARITLVLQPSSASLCHQTCLAGLSLTSTS